MSVAPHGVTSDRERVSIRLLDGFFRRRDGRDDSSSKAITPRLFERFELATVSWAQFVQNVGVAQSAPPPDGYARHIKVLLFLRHGEGLHNAAVNSMGKLKWNAEGVFDVQYIDPHLTPAGVLDAQQRGAPAVAQELQRGMPPIQCCITSPLSRAIETATHFFAPEHAPRPFVAIESCREVVDTHTCNQRRPLSQIQESFPDVDFSHMEHVDEIDTFWSQLETRGQQHERIVGFLAQVCREFSETYIAVSSHADFIRELWTLLDGERLEPAHCEVCPMVVEVLERL